ncbi:MAG: SIS domain-containing protein [Candidatus Lokiarchaeota archaeon]|nr:SIS domain-containing protein [Candidatus Lokiarchaeota archaeon]
MRNQLKRSAEIKEFVSENYTSMIAEICNIICTSLKKGNKVIIFGNGGSAADSQHIAAEFIGRFNFDRRSLPAIALTTDTSILTAIGNDYGFDNIFIRQLEALWNDGDVILAISTSGNSPNVIKAVEFSRDKKLISVGFLGRDGGLLKDLVDFPIIIPDKSSARIQEAHITIGHIICGIVEQEFFK